MTLLQTFQVALVIGSLSITASCSASPPPAAASNAPAESMRAVVHSEYGTTEVLRLDTVSLPVPNAKQVLVKVHAAAVNPVDWHFMTGKPYFLRFMSGVTGPKRGTVGRDLAGKVVAVGADVTKFKVGDAVFGVGPGAFAEYSLAAERRLAAKPAGLAWEDAAAVPVAAVTALQALRDHGKVQPGQKILINGASGGVGTFMVQLAKAMGAQVTGVCSGRNVELVRSLGADHVVDYTQEDFTAGAERYDVILDNVGNRSLSELRKVLAPAGTLVGIGGGKSKDASWGFSLIGGMIEEAVIAPFTDQQFASFMAEVLTADLEHIAGLMQQGKLRSVIDRRYPLAEVPQALDYLRKGHARGKVIVSVR